MSVATKSIVVLGAGGFIGRSLVARLAAAGEQVRAVTRRPTAFAPGIETIAAGTLDSRTDWPALLGNARAVVHLASTADAPLGDESWIAEAEAAAGGLAAFTRAGSVEHLILVSSIKAMGDTSNGTPFRADAVPHPTDSYGRAKWRIEAALTDAPNLTVLRPPLVYGPGVRGNFRSLLALADRGFPLPLASVDNRRSFVFIENLIDLVLLALDRPEPVSGTFLLRDPQEISTPELIRRMARQLGRPARLWPCPPTLLRLAATTAGRRGVADRLLGSISIDDSATRARFGWIPRFSLDDGLAATCRWFRDQPPAGTG